MITRRGVATFCLFLVGVLAGAAWMGRSTSDALSMGYGGAVRSCVPRVFSYPQYGIYDVIEWCGSIVHRGGWA